MGLPSLCTIPNARATCDANELAQEVIGFYLEHATKNTVLTLYRGIADLKNFPNRGRSGRIDGTRELIFPSLPYIAVYRFHKGAVEVVRVYHAAQDWP